MSSINLSSWFNNLFLFVQRLTTKKFWRVKLTIFLVLSSLFFCTPPFLVNAHFFTIVYWESFSQKREHPLSQLNYPDDTNMAKKNFRLTMPVIAHVFHLNDWTVYALQLLSSVLLLFFCLLFVEQFTGDAVSAIFTTIGLTFIYTGHAGFTDIGAWFDEFAYLFLLLAMFSKKPYLVFLWTQLACWNDERAIIACGLVFIWWKLQELTVKNFTLKNLFRPQLNSLTTIISVIVYFVARYLIAATFHLRSPTGNVGFKVFFQDSGFFGLGWWEALVGFWILAICGTIVLLKENRLLLFVILFVMSLIVFGAYSVFDITRSAAYIFPVVFIFLFILKEYFSINDVRKILFLSAAICFLFPSYYIISPDILWYKPLPVRVLDLIKHHLYGHAIDLP